MAFWATVFSVAPGRWFAASQIRPSVTVVPATAPVTAGALMSLRFLGGVGVAAAPGTAGDHPVSWCQYYDGGRAWLTTLGHDVKAWTDEPLDGDQHFVRHLLGGVKSVMGMAPFCR
ncbi:ThuA domain-containing protein [Nonomuraea jabiensis]|uniref:ThuA domain-containing protein n=1 Tax=Nonomuraea jabiensis TaxID=882448 RepID=UPI003445B5A4